MRKIVKCILVGTFLIIGMLTVEIIVLKPTLTSMVPLKERTTSNYSLNLEVIEPQKIDWQNYKTVSDIKFYIFSVIAAKSARNRTWDLIVVNGWEIGRATNESYKCCFFDDHGKTTFSVTNNKRFFMYNSNILGSRQVVCEIPPGIVPKTFSLLLLSDECDINAINTNIVYPKPEKDGKFAVCGKIAYGKKIPNHLIEWIEYQRYMGASKIVLYTYQDLNKDALKVVQYYSDIGVIEAVPYPFVPRGTVADDKCCIRQNYPACKELKDNSQNFLYILDKTRYNGTEIWPRYFSKQGYSLMYNDEQVPNFDTQERLREYTYFTVMDTDEFIAPNRSIARNYSQLMDYLLQKYKNTGNFPMRSHFHLMSWNKTNPESDLMLGQFGNRSNNVYDSVKLIHVTDRIVPGSLWIHDGIVKPGYHKVVPKDTEVVFKHYRLCRDSWLKPSKEHNKPNKCFGGFKMHYDTYMEEVIAAIGPRVRKIKEILRLGEPSI